MCIFVAHVCVFDSVRAMGNLQQALVCFEKRLVVAHELGECGGKAQAYGELGSLHSQLGNYEQAISCLERQLGIARDTQDRLLEGDASCGLGAVYQLMGEHDTALQFHQLDLQIAEETGSASCQGRAYGNLGLTYESLGNFERAVVYQEQHLSIAAQTNDLAAKTLAYSSLGRTHHALQNYSQSVMYLQEGKRHGDSHFDARIKKTQLFSVESHMLVMQTSRAERLNNLPAETRTHTDRVLQPLYQSTLAPPSDSQLAESFLCAQTSCSLRMCMRP